jgi:hypothetical protein
MVATTWGWKGWIVAGIAAWLFIAVAGAVTGVMFLRGRLGLGAVGVSWAARLGLATGVVFVMAVKPGAIVAIAAIVVGLVLGLAAAVPGRRLVGAP